MTPSRQGECLVSLGLPQGNSSTTYSYAGRIRAIAGNCLPKTLTRWTAAIVSFSRCSVSTAMQHSLRTVVAAVASCAVSRAWSIDSVLSGWQQLVGATQSWMQPEANEIHARFKTRPSRECVANYLIESGLLRKAFVRSKRLRRICWYIGDTTFVPPAQLPVADWGIPVLADPAEVATLLDISETMLWQLADHRRFYQLPRCHYRFRWSRKRSGGVRLIEAPKFRMKVVQQRLLKRLVGLIPIHPAAHGFRAGRSIRTMAACHTRKLVVIRIDLRDFFTSVSGARIAAIFRTVGYPENVTQVLTRMCTSQVPRRIWQNCPNDLIRDMPFETRDRLSRWHLPQGAPTSPALANLAAFRLDKRLEGLARHSLGTYTRYADDLVFSGHDRLARNADGIVSAVMDIAADEGFEVNPRKTNVMRQSVRQKTCGLTVNDTVNTSRKQYKALQAILHNCVVHGPDTQNRDGHRHFRQHIEGQVAFHESINMGRGKKLRVLFDRIRWP